MLERKAPPTFPLLIEMRERAFWVTHWVEDSVDCLLHGKAPVVQVCSSDYRLQQQQSRCVGTKGKSSCWQVFARKACIVFPMQACDSTLLSTRAVTIKAACSVAHGSHQTRHLASSRPSCNRALCPCVSPVLIGDLVGKSGPKLLGGCRPGNVPNVQLFRSSVQIASHSAILKLH